MTRAQRHGPVRGALEVTLSSDPRLSQPRAAALVALCRVTADEVDKAGSEVSSRLIASYLSALKDVERLLSSDKTAAPAGQEGASSGGTVVGRFRSVAGGKAS